MSADETHVPPASDPALTRTAGQRRRSFAMAEQLDDLIVELERRGYASRRALKADLRAQLLVMSGEL
jgi:hypothetical protein